MKRKTEDTKQGKGGNPLYSVADMMAALDEARKIVETQDPPPPPKASIAAFVQANAREMAEIVKHSDRGWTMASFARVLSEQMAARGIDAKPETLSKSVRTKKAKPDTAPKKEPEAAPAPDEAPKPEPAPAAEKPDAKPEQAKTPERIPGASGRAAVGTNVNNI